MNGAEFPRGSGHRLRAVDRGRGDIALSSVYSRKSFDSIHESSGRIVLSSASLAIERR